MEQILLEGLKVPQSDLLVNRAPNEKGVLLDVLRKANMNAVPKRRSIVWTLELEALKLLHLKGVLAFEELCTLLIKQCQFSHLLNQPICKYLELRGFKQESVQKALVAILNGFTPAYENKICETQIKETFMDLVFYYVVLKNPNKMPSFYIDFCYELSEQHLGCSKEVVDAYLKRKGIHKDRVIAQFREEFSKYLPLLNEFLLPYTEKGGIRDKAMSQSLSGDILNVISQTSNSKKRRETAKEVSNKKQIKPADRVENTFMLPSPTEETQEPLQNAIYDVQRILPYIQGLASAIGYRLVSDSYQDKAKIELIKVLTTSKSDYVLSELKEATINDAKYSKDDLLLLINSLFVSLSCEGIEQNSMQVIGEEVNLEPADVIKKYILTHPVMKEHAFEATIRYPEWLFNGSVIVPMVVTSKERR